MSERCCRCRTFLRYDRARSRQIHRVETECRALVTDLRKNQGQSASLRGARVQTRSSACFSERASSLERASPSCSTRWGSLRSVLLQRSSDVLDGRKYRRLRIARSRAESCEAVFAGGLFFLYRAIAPFSATSFRPGRQRDRRMSVLTAASESLDCGISFVGVCHQRAPARDCSGGSPSTL